MSPDEQTQQDWSNLLANEKLQHQQMLRVPIAVRQKQIDDQITYYKGVLKRNLLAGIADNKDTLIKKLIELRATQTVINLLSLEENHGYLQETDILEEAERYVQDSLTLANTFGVQ